MPAADAVRLPAENPRSTIRPWRLAIGPAILALAAILFCLAWNWYADDLTYQIMWAYYIWPGAIFLFVLWWLFLTGLPWKARLKGLTVFAAAVVSLLLVFRFDRFDGAMQPAFSGRFHYPAWPVATFLMIYLSTVFSDWRWKTRVLSAAGILGAAGLSLVLGFTGFDLSRDGRAFAAEGRLSEEAQRTANTLKDKDAEFDPYADPSNWPIFRGPQRDGVVRGDNVSNIRFDWTDENRPKNLWKDKQRAGAGWSSFAVVGGFVITQEQRPEGETVVGEAVVCYDFANGSQIWIHADEERFSEPMGGVGPRATPTVAGRRVYTLGAKGTLNCLDLLTGKRLWYRNILKDAGAKNLSWGMSGSPLVTGNLVIVNPGKGGDKAVIAYNRMTGDIVWATGNQPASYSSPSITRIHGVDQLLIFHGVGLTAYDPKTGKELWNYGPWTNQPEVNVAIPIVRDIDGETLVFISSGYQSGCAVLKISLTDGKWTAAEAKKQVNRFRLKFNDGIYHNGYVYGLDETILSCVDFKTGELKWRMRGGFGYGQMLLVGETLVITAENGRVSFVKASPTKPTGIPPGFQALNRDIGPLDRKGIGWNQPVIVRGRLLIRNDREVACFDLTRP